MVIDTSVGSVILRIKYLNMKISDHLKKTYYQLRAFIYKIPVNIRIEACTLCDLDCADCYMRKDNYANMGKGYLKFVDFKNLIERNPFIQSVELSMSGEIFLNPELLEIIKFADEKKIKLTAYNGVNFNNISDKMIENLVKYKFDGLTFSIDGTSNETYSQYRRKGNFDKVIDNIKKLNYYKALYKSKFPNLRWQFILMNHNEHELLTAKKMCKELGMEKIYFLFPWDGKYQPKDVDLIEQETDLIFKRSTYEKHELKYKKYTKHFLCNQLWNQPQFNWDGRLLGCCCGTYIDLGINLFTEGYEGALRSPKLKYMKRVLRGECAPDESIPCFHCKTYKFMKEKNRFINLP